jgi:ADP-dependent NAD(P)H-hydrate dehydratase / NAD(P)H-hydrate epimerase
MKLVTTAHMRALEQAAVDAGATWPGLIEQAGWGVAQEALRLLGEVAGRRVLVLVGPGNNGADGLVVARHLHDAGGDVALYLWRRADSPDDANRARCRERGIPEHESASDTDRVELRRLLAGCDLVVDALLGMGISRAVEGEPAEIVETVNSAGRLRSAEDGGWKIEDGRSSASPSSILHPPSSPDQSVVGGQWSVVGGRPSVLALDLPTGIHSDTGQVMGVALAADVSVATGLAKRGLFYYPGRAYAGEIRAVDIGLAPAQLEALMSETMIAERMRDLLPARPDDSHKGTFGKVLVVAGSILYPGAASLATGGAARIGAGVVTLASGRSAMGGPERLPEVTLRPLPEAEWGVLGEASAEELLKHLEGYQALLVGPGIGREEATREFLERLLGLDSPRHRGQIGFRIGVGAEKPAIKQRPELPPTVIDADALTLLGQIDKWWDHLPRGRCVLTPHPGEMKRLLGVEELEGDRVKVAEEAAERWGQVVVLKGATTVVAGPDGRILVHDGGNAALATAGTGDVLAGAIAGLLAQGLAPLKAAALGVFLHSAAGRLVREDLGDMGTLASDLLPRLPLAIKRLKG